MNFNVVFKFIKSAFSIYDVVCSKFVYNADANKGVARGRLRTYALNGERKTYHDPFSCRWIPATLFTLYINKKHHIVLAAHFTIFFANCKYSEVRTVRSPKRLSPRLADAGVGYVFLSYLCRDKVDDSDMTRKVYFFQLVKTRDNKLHYVKGYFSLKH